MRVQLLLCSVLTFVACGGESKPSKPSAEDKAATEAAKKQQEVADEASLAERKAKREADEKAKADAEEKIAAEIAGLLAAPTKVHRDPVLACDEVSKAQDAFVRRVGGPEVIKEWDGGGKDRAIPMTVVQCTQADSLEAAGCMKHMFEAAGEDLRLESKRMIKACIDKYASKRRPPAGGVPKRRPAG